MELKPTDVLGNAKEKAQNCYRNLRHRGVISLLDQSVVSGTNFLTSIIIGRSVVRAEFGLYVLCFTIVVLVSNLQTALISTPYTLRMPKLDKSDVAHYSGSTLVHQFCVGLMTVLILILCGSIMTILHLFEDLPKALFILSLIMPFLLLREYIRRLLFAHLKFSLSLSLDLVISITQLSGLLLLSSTNFFTIYTALSWIGISCILPGLVLLFQMREDFLFHRGRIKSDLSLSWLTSRWLFGGNLTDFAGTQAYPWLLAAFHGAATTGVFGACLGPLFLANPVFIGAGNFFAPNMAHEFEFSGIARLRKLVGRGTSLLSVFTLMFGIVLGIWGDQIVVFLYGSKYAGNGPVIAVLALSLLFTGMAIPIHNALLAIGKLEVTFWSRVMTLVVTLTIGVWLAKDFGLLGAAISTVAARVVGVCFLFAAYSSIVSKMTKGQH